MSMAVPVVSTVAAMSTTPAVSVVLSASMYRLLPVMPLWSMVMDVPVLSFSAVRSDAPVADAWSFFRFNSVNAPVLDELATMLTPTPVVRASRSGMSSAFPVVSTAADTLMMSVVVCSLSMSIEMLLLSWSMTMPVTALFTVDGWTRRPVKKVGISFADGTPAPKRTHRSRAASWLLRAGSSFQSGRRVICVALTRAWYTSSPFESGVGG